MTSYLKDFFLGNPLNPFNPKVRKHIALIALMGWIGLGADALSSSCYGPEEAFLALGSHSHLALYIAALTVFTIFIISIGYNQVIELFPNGGGGYKVASILLHPYLGLISGCALIVDYVLTIAVSIASGTDAIFSFMPIWLMPYKLYIEIFAILFLMALNLRGIKEAIIVLMPIFFGFVISHFILIVYGISAHASQLTTIIPATVMETNDFAKSVGWFAVIGLTLHAYSLGSGTYTGLEAVSNNVQRFVEPRIKTAKRTMLYMALSLSFTAGGIILLYLLWHAEPIPGQTLNAVVFHSILGDSWIGKALLIVILELEAGLLLIAANTGFVDGPNVLSNMAIDGWVPSQFRHLSSRLVVQNGLLLIGSISLGILLYTHGDVKVLVVLYSINVFITFSLSLLSISVYWIKHRSTSAWKWHFLLTSFACIVTTSILAITLFYKFAAGGWVTLLITTTLIIICLFIKRHYQYVKKKLFELSKILEQPLIKKDVLPYAIDPQLPTAVIFVNNFSVGMHTLTSILRLFPHQFRNFIFLSAGSVDVESFSGHKELERLQIEINGMLDYFVKFANQNHFPAEAYSAFGTDAIEELKKLSDQIGAAYPHAIFFSSQLVFRNENMITRFLHNQTPLILQHHLHFQGKELMIIPMRL